MPKWQELCANERKAGYLDAAVVGGFSEYILDFALRKNDAAHQRLADTARFYQWATVAQRPQILDSMESQLVALFGADKVDEPKKDAVKKETVKKASAAKSLQYLKGIGPKRAEMLKKLGLETTDDVLWFLPRMYQQRGEVRDIADLNVGENATVEGEIVTWSGAATRTKLYILKAVIRDDSGTLAAVWFNQRYVEQKFRRGMRVRLYGQLKKNGRYTEFNVQDYQLDIDAEDNASAILPVYPATEGLNQKWLRSLVKDVWQQHHEDIYDIFDKQERDELGLMSRHDALEHLHFPQDLDMLERARRTLAFEELVVLQGAVQVNRISDVKKVGIARAADKTVMPRFNAALPFELTDAQKRVIAEIFADMENAEPMARLVQGDVGSGKTFVAAAALYKNALSGHLGAMMAPTEILAAQHFATLQPFFEKLGMTVALFTGSLTAKKRTELSEKLLNNEIDVIIGTHTLIQQDVELPRLGLVITDEQHRFGVMQRNALSQKGEYPDTLIMTATPIPRTLTLTLYGDMKISIIDGMPPGRQQIDTFAVTYDYEPRVFNFIKKHIAAGRQAYIVCPLVEESDAVDLQAASALAQRLSAEDFADYRVGLLHGKMKPAQKDEIMNEFAAGNLDILVSTTVIEVGINVPNATVMLVRDAERFGLAQLHQLRGRVGRGSEKSYCILMHNAHSQIARERMQIMSKTNDGFVIADADLKLRGSGDVLGVRQHGLPQIKIARLPEDIELLSSARDKAQQIITQDGWQTTELGRKILIRSGLLSV